MVNKIISFQTDECEICGAELDKNIEAQQDEQGQCICDDCADKDGEDE